MRLDANVMNDRKSRESRGYRLPQYDRSKIISDTRKNPLWIHFGAGIIFRTFHANLAQRLLNEGDMNRGIIVAVNAFAEKRGE